MMNEIVQLSKDDTSWEDFERDWRTQCDLYGESFDDYAIGSFLVLRELVDAPEMNAGVFSVRSDSAHRWVFQVNTTPLPGYDSPVMRVRHLTMCPDLDFGDHPVEHYIDALVHAFSGVLFLSDDHSTMGARHIKFHLRSPNDRHFFKILGASLNEAEEFESVRVAGSWLYITKA